MGEIKKNQKATLTNTAAKKADRHNSTTKLTEKQKKFCKYLASGLNATQAAIKAGYSAKTARQMGSENLSKPYISEIAQQNAQEAQQKFEYTKELHFRELHELQEMAQKRGNVTAAINAVVQKGKLCGLYIEKQELTVKEPRRFVFEIKK